MMCSTRPVVAIYSNPSSLGGSEVYLQRVFGPLLSENWEFVFFGGEEHPLRSWIADTHKFRYVSLGKLGITPVESIAAQEQCTIAATKDYPIQKVKEASLRFVPKSIKLLMGTIRQILTLKKMFKAHRVDLIHFNDTGCEPACIAAWMARIPTITGTFHVAPATDSYSTYWVRMLIEWLSVRTMHRAIAVSRATGDAWAERTGLDAARIKVIYNGIDTSEYIDLQLDREAFLSARGFDPTSHYVAVPARLHWMKGHSILFGAIAQGRAAMPSAKFLLIGDGSLRRDLMDEVDVLGINDRVHFLGHCSNVREWFAVSDLVVLPSVALEAFPLALLEAMASGKAIVSTDVGGIAEMLDHGEAGVVVQPSKPEELLQSIAWMLDNKEVRKSFSAEARKRAQERFSISETVRATREFLVQSMGSI